MNNNILHGMTNGALTPPKSQRPGQHTEDQDDEDSTYTRDLFGTPGPEAVSSPTRELDTSSSSTNHDSSISLPVITQSQQLPSSTQLQTQNPDNHGVPISPPSTSQPQKPSSSSSTQALNPPKLALTDAEKSLAAFNAAPTTPLDDDGNLIYDSDSSSSDEEGEFSTVVAPRNFRTPKTNQATDEHVVPGNYYHQYHIRVATVPTPFALRIINTATYKKSSKEKKKKIRKKVQEAERAAEAEAEAAAMAGDADDDDGNMQQRQKQKKRPRRPAPRQLQDSELYADDLFPGITTQCDSTENKNPYAWVYGDSALGPVSSGSHAGDGGEVQPFIRLRGVGPFDTPGEAAEVAGDFLFGRFNKSLVSLSSRREMLDRHEAKRLGNRLAHVDERSGMFRGWVEREDGCHVYVKTQPEATTLKRKRQPSFSGQEVYMVFEQRCLPRKVKPGREGKGEDEDEKKKLVVICDSKDDDDDDDDDSDEGDEDDEDDDEPDKNSTIASRNDKNSHNRKTKTETETKTEGKTQDFAPPSPGPMPPPYLITVPIQIASYTTSSAANLCALSYFREVTRPSNQRIEDNTFYQFDLCQQLDRISAEGISPEPMELIFETWKYPAYKYPFRWIRVSVSKGWIQGRSALEKEVHDEKEELRRQRERVRKSKQLRLVKEREERVALREHEVEEREEEVERKEEGFRVRDEDGNVVLSYGF
ncbi:hypothetical protein MKZ38_002963 [Zalerion maritima]|uniref:Uncharacterized protein n=1 Tax=Zalerion maritima TaxID=339359 RepID=A0AAD5RNX6_9PEZI|nr:hypothetical protein MKZ38_002963 [Zalerion maritima]